MKYKLGDICEIVSGSTPKTNVPEYWDGNVKWITPAEINEDSYIITDSERKITELGVKKTGLTPFPKGTVILSSRAPIGKVAIAGCEMYCNQGFKNLICSETIYNKYLYWFLKGNTEFLNSLGRGATFKEISKAIVSSIEINLPSMEFQKGAVRILEKTNNIINYRKKQLQALDDLIKARFVEMFGDPIPNNKALPWRKLSEISKLKSGKAIKTGELSEDKRSNTPYPCYGGNGIRGFINRYSHEGDFPIIGRQGAWAGNVNYATGQFYATEHAVVATPIINLNTIWYYHSLKLLNLYRFQTGAAQPGLAVEKLNEVLIPFPEVSYQNQFATFVSQVDKSKFVVQKALNEAQLLFDSLMQEYFG